MSTTIFIVEDELMAINYLRTLIKECGDEYQVVGDATNGARAIPEIKRLQPNIVFADICMPIMDGLKMSEEVLKSKNPPVVFILSSYKDFEYAQKGIKAGVKDYILKNDLSADFLKDLLEKTTHDIETEKRNRYILLEHNIKRFLNAKSSSEEDLLYSTKPLQRYAIIHFSTKQLISLDDLDKRTSVSIDCYKMNNLVAPEGLLCSAFLEVENGEYIAIIFIQPQCRNEKEVLKSFAQIYLDEFKNQCNECDVKVLISPVVLRFSSIQTLYAASKENKNYLYSFENKDIIWNEEIESKLAIDLDIDSLIGVLKNSLKSQDCQQCIELYKKIISAMKEAFPYKKYMDGIKKICKCLVDEVTENKMNPEIVNIPTEYISISEMESAIENEISLYFDKKSKSDGTNISVYVLSAIDYIQKNYMNNISICDIADAVNISEGHLRRCFKQEMKIKLVNYLMEYRINNAKKLMQGSQKTLDEIWKQTGFTSAQYFSYAFKQQEGMTPRDYIKNARKES